jgi:hypothetical protein
MRLIALVTMMTALATAERAYACASCGCGDPTLTAVGVEKPYKNRLRVAVEERVGQASLGTGVGRERLLMTRTGLGVSYTPETHITFSAYLPYIASHLDGPETLNAWVHGLGDLDLQARVLVFRDHRFSPHHLLWLMAGVKAPTGPRVRDAQGFPFSDDNQPGTGAWDPEGGITYAWFGGKSLSLFHSFIGRYTTYGPRGYRFGSSVTSVTTLQFQPFERVAFQMGGELLYTWADQLQNHADAPNTGGVVVALAPAVLYNPYRDLLLRFSVEIPVFQDLRGIQVLGTQFIFTVSYDIL